MSSGLDMSLDDLIKQSKAKPKGGGPASSSGPIRRAPPASRAAPYLPAGPKAAATAASPYGVYSEHVAAMTAVAPRPPPTAVRSLETGTKLHVSNLDASVTVDDVQELFSEIGELKRYSVNYDKDGKSQGTAEVVFARKVDALDAIKRYDGVLLDGKPMKIDLIRSNSEPSPAPPTAPLLYNSPFPNYNTIPHSAPQRGGQRGPFQGNGRPGSIQGIGGGPRGIFQGGGRSGSSSQGNGDRGQGKPRGQEWNRVQKSAADLDAELDKYHAEAVKQK
ncbi:hypothetical protein GUJ93_ZPchr0007g6367 [Zizania palustris]|uniref:RRM domain-containing protein n=1 Tax=Zizania palustris TaxID=103762 RepID=A0A8J5TEX3_ZIZPA|nr:hypothetical protein GUJ93_ZPchr0007g6367 [Zizania palustris]